MTGLIPANLIPVIIITIALSLLVWVILLIKRVYQDKEINTLKEISLVGEKINLDTRSKPLTDLVNDSNKEHGAGLEQDQGSDSAKGGDGSK